MADEVRERAARSERLAALAIVGLVLAIVAALHAPGMAGSFLSDDFSALELLHRNDQAGTLGAWLAERFVAPLPGMSSAYRPLGFLSFALDWRLFGVDATGWHLTSLLVHLANALLAYVVVRRWLRGVEGSRVAAALAAALFAAYPFVGELTTWVAARPDLLAATFCLLFLATLDGRPAGPSRHALRVALFAAALLSKESAAPLPAAAFLVDLALFRADSAAGWRARLGFAVRDLAPVAVAFAVYLGWRYVLFGNAFKVYPNSGLPHGAGELRDRLSMLGTMVVRQTEGAPAHRWPLVASALLLLVVAGASWRGTRAPRPWRGIAAACALAALIYLVAPSLSLPAIEAEGTGARNYYLAWAYASIALGCVSGATAGARAAAAIFAGWLLVGQAANLAQWQYASREMKAVTRAIPAFAQSIPADGYALLLLPDSVGPALFARNSQSALVAPPVQAQDHVDRVVGMTEADFANWRGHFREGTIARLKRAPSFDASRFAGVFCWNPAQRAFVSVVRPGAVTDFDAWEREVRAGVAARGCLRGTLRGS
jgi:hypothetical protein